MNAKQEMEAQAGAYRHMMHVGGRGHGKVAMKNAIIQAYNGEPIPVSVVDNGFSIGPVEVQDSVLYSAPNYAAQMEFSREYVLSHEDMAKMFHSMTFRRGVLGMYSMEYTPAEELRDRLNDRLRGKEPVAAINTRYWRNL